MSRTQLKSIVKASILLFAPIAMVGCAAKPAAMSAAPVEVTNASEGGEKANAPVFELGSLGEEAYPGDAISVRVESQKGTERTSRTLTVIGLFPLADSSFKAEATIRQTGTHVEVDCPLVLTLMTVLDEKGGEVGKADGGIPTEMFANGLYRAYDAMDRIIARAGLSRSMMALQDDSGELWQHASEDEIREIIVGFTSLQSMGYSLARNKVFKKMLGDAVQRPSLFSMLFGVTISIGTREGELPTRTSYTIGNETLPAYIIPMQLLINDEKAMLFELTVVPLRPPLGLSGGVVALDAHHPTKSDVTISVRLIGAKRGGPIDWTPATPSVGGEASPAASGGTQAEGPTEAKPAAETTPKGAPVDP